MSSDQLKNKKYIQKGLFQIRVLRVNLRQYQLWRRDPRALGAGPVAEDLHIISGKF